MVPEVVTVVLSEVAADTQVVRVFLVVEVIPKVLRDLIKLSGFFEQLFGHVLPRIVLASIAVVEVVLVPLTEAVAVRVHRVFIVLLVSVE